MNKFAGGRIKNKLQILSSFLIAIGSLVFTDYPDSQKEASSNPYQIIYVFSIDSQLVLSWIENFFLTRQE